LQYLHVGKVLVHHLQKLNQDRKRRLFVHELCSTQHCIGPEAIACLFLVATW